MWSEGIYILQAQNLFVIWPKDTQNKKLMWSYLHCFFLILLYRYVFGPSSIIMHMCRQCARIAKKIFMLWHQTCMLCLHLSKINKGTSTWTVQYRCALVLAEMYKITENIFVIASKCILCLHKFAHFKLQICTSVVTCTIHLDYQPDQQYKDCLVN